MNSSSALFKKLNSTQNGGGIHISIDGISVSADLGDSVAAVILRMDQPFARTTPVSGSPRTPFCMMGVCFDCLAIVDGVASTQTCLVSVRDGMKVERQNGRPRIVMAGGSFLENGDAAFEGGAISTGDVS